ncbi:hypothetical protein [Paludibacter propionicigenes]|uniref:hypothetical protein n=1 Tax=Paludibacter propionicigenes TaxID=185300 RepID=UPI001494A0C3|nr:hypothetical protein [Paludibacter propionicigenes]
MEKTSRKFGTPLKFSERCSKVGEARSKVRNVAKFFGTPLERWRSLLENSERR